MVPASSALGVDNLDNVDNMTTDNARPKGHDALAVLANYSPDIPPEEVETVPSDEVAAKKSRHPLASRKPTKLAPLYESAIIGLGLVGLAVGYVAWRLSEGSVSISAAAPLVEDALDRFIGGKTKIGSLRLGWNDAERNFVVTADQITATTNARTAPLALGQVNLTLNAKALLMGQTQISRADISGVTAVLVLDKDGAMAFGFGTLEQVLALPRKKPPARGLSPLLDSVRETLLFNNKNGRVDAISLRNAQLTIIDPQTNQRLTLTDAKANITTDSNNVVTMQAAGQAREMGGFANVAIAASPNQSERPVIAARFENARLSALPSSLRVGPLMRLAGDNAPISGSALIYLGQDKSDTNVLANVSLGVGRVQGFDVKSGDARLDWQGGPFTMLLSNVSASGPQGSIVGGNGRVDHTGNATTNISFDARDFLFADAKFGSLSGANVRGSAQLSADNQPVAATLNGASISLSRQNQAVVNAKDFGLVVTTPSRNPSLSLQADLTAREIDGVLGGDGVSARGLSLQITANRSGMTVTPISVSGNAATARYDMAMAGVRQSFDASGLIIDANDFAATGPRAISVRAAQLAFGQGNQSPINGTATDVNFVINGILTNQERYQGRVSTISVRGNGAVSMGASGRAITFDVTQTGDIAGTINRLQANALTLSAGEGGATTNGLIASGSFNGQTLSGTKLTADNIEVTHATGLVRPFWADDLRVSGDFTPRSASLDAFSLRHRGVTITGDTQIARAPVGSPRVILAAEVDGAFSVETLLSAWPVRFLRETRGSIQRLIPEGTAEVSRLELNIPAGMKKKQVLPKNGMALDFTLRDVTVRYLSGMSSITGVSGTGQLVGDSLAIDLPTGRIGDMALTNGRVEIPQFMPSGAHVNISATVTGNVTDMAREIDLPPLAVLTNSGLSADRLSGQGSAQLALDIPLKPVLQPEDIGVRVAGDFQQAGLTRTFAGLDAYNGTVHLGVTGQKVEVSGMAWMAGNLFDFDWYRDPSATMGSQVSLNATGLVTIDSLQAIGIDARAYAQGPFQIDIESSSQGTQLGEALLTANLINTNISLPGNVWNKVEGVPAAASAKLYPREGGGWNVQDLRFDSAGAVLRGALDITDDAKLVDARFSRVMIDNTADLSVDVTPSAQALTVTMRGAYLNLSPYLDKKDVSEKAVDLLDRPLTLSADIARVATAPNRELTNVHADIVRDKDGWRTFEAAGSAPAGRSQISLSMQRDGRRSISGVLSDAGFFAQLLYPGAPVFGGTGTIEGELPVAGANSSGNLTFMGKDIELVREGTSAIMFSNVNLPMSVRGGVVTLRDGQADGDAYTVKASGYVDVAEGRLDFRGVATPGGLNRVLADIPLFGAILGGGQDEGLLGMTFRARGALTAPKLQTNPISALAPGFLRKLFESEAPLSPQPRLIAVPFTGVPLVLKWPYGPTEDMSERPNVQGGAVGPTQ
jgi:Protein of unknown function/AsmA-like C-terminal region